MKNKQLHFFLFEFTISLIILSVSLLVAFTLFTKAAVYHSETQALRKLSEAIVIQAEHLRNPSTIWPSTDQSKVVTSTYDVKGKQSESDVHYTLTITYEPNSSLNQAEFVLTNKANVILLQMKVSTLSELIP